MLIVIIIAIITILILYVWLKPYFIKYDTTLLFTGGLGTGKTLSAVKKTGIKIFKKMRLTVRFRNWKITQINKIKIIHNNRIKKQYERNLDKGKRIHRKQCKFWELNTKYELPRFITNIPVRIRKGKHEEWSTVLEKDMLLLKKRIPEYSVILIDEFPQLINQFNWSIKEVQDNVNEFATFFRHYIGGKLILTAQADSEIVKQVRSKMNTYYHLSNFRKFLFIFYKYDICQFIASEIVDNVSMGFYEDNTKTVYGCLLGKNYDSRCFSIRYDKLPPTTYKRWGQFKTKRIIRFSKYESPLDEEQIKETN